MLQQRWRFLGKDPAHESPLSCCLQQIILEIYDVDCLLNLFFFFFYTHPSSSLSNLHPIPPLVTAAVCLTRIFYHERGNKKYDSILLSICVFHSGKKKKKDSLTALCENVNCSPVLWMPNVWCLAAPVVVRVCVDVCACVFLPIHLFYSSPQLIHLQLTPAVSVLLRITQLKYTVCRLSAAHGLRPILSNINIGFSF